MQEKQYEVWAIGDVVPFTLDNNPSHSGSGVIQGIYPKNRQMEVTLKASVKEFKKGENIIVCYDEINA